MPKRGWLITLAVLSGAVFGLVSWVRGADALAAAIAAAALSLVAPSRPIAMALLFGCLSLGAVANAAAARDRALRPPLVAWFDEVAGRAERLTEPVELDGTITEDAAVVGDSVRLLVDV